MRIDEPRLPEMRTECKTTVHVASCFDKAMMLSATALVTSIAETKAPTSFVVLHLLTDPSVACQIATLIAEIERPDFRVEVRHIDATVFSVSDDGDVAGTDYFPLSALYRLRLDVHLPDVDRLLYLDADTIVRRDIHDLYDIDLKGMVLAAMPDFALSTMHSLGETVCYGEHTPAVDTYITTALRTNYVDYFNSGVLVIDLARWRREQIGVQALAFIASHARAVFPDQDALNHVIKGNYVRLDPRWNACVYLAGGPGDGKDMPEDWDTMRTVQRFWLYDPWIIHFAGPRKPWRPTGAPTTVYDRDFWDYTGRTRFGQAMMKTLGFEINADGDLRQIRGTAISPILPTDVVIPRPKPNYKGLPTVSFVVVNYNYGRFLRQCVESILLQDYPLVECIIVDDLSTDDSRDTMASLAERYPTLIVHHRLSNGGQSRACVDGFRLSKGAFVTFVDADDYLLPGFATTHVRAHLSLPQAVGFTSGDVAQMLGEEMVSSTYFEAARQLDATRLRPISPNELKQVCETSRAAERLFARTQNLGLRFVDPTEPSWVWSPMSGNMYRRAALSLITDNPLLDNLRKSTDAYFNLAINALTGSVLIDKPVAVYRIHGSNNFTSRAPLHRTVGYAKTSDVTSHAAYCALQHILNNFEMFDGLTQTPLDLWASLRTLQRRAADHPTRGLALRRFASSLVKRYWGIRGLRLKKFYARKHRKSYVAK